MDCNCVECEVIPDEFEDLEDSLEPLCYPLESDGYDEIDCIDEPCSNCGSYSHWSDKCKRCEDCKAYVPDYTLHDCAI